MNILLVSSYLPYPLFSGGHVRLYNLLKILGKKHNITLVCEKRPHQTESDVAEVKKLCSHVVTIARKKQWSLPNILKTGFSPYPFLLIGHTSKVMQDAITHLLSKNSFDLIHVETSYVFQNLPKVTIPIVLVEHNIEYLVYKRYANASPLILRPLLLLDVFKLRFFEEQFWKRAKKVVAVSKDEQKIIGRDNTAVVPNGVDTQLFTFPDIEKKITNRKTVLFIGDFKWIQNRDAAIYILKDIWPNIMQSAKFKIQNAKLWIVGREIPESIRKLTNDSSVVFDENPPHATPEIFAKADLLLSPVRIGGGTSYKILEAMASGVPVVTTSLGIEGIDATHNTDVVIADSKEELAAAVNIVFSDQDFYASLAKNARRLVEKKYDWRIIAQTLDDVYKSVV